MEERLLENFYIAREAINFNTIADKKIDYFYLHILP